MLGMILGCIKHSGILLVAYQIAVPCILHALLLSEDRSTLFRLFGAPSVNGPESARISTLRRCSTALASSYWLQSAPVVIPLALRYLNLQLYQASCWFNKRKQQIAPYCSRGSFHSSLQHTNGNLSFLQCYLRFLRFYFKYWILIRLYCFGFEVFTAVTAKNIFPNVMPYILITSLSNFRRKCTVSIFRMSKANRHCHCYYKTVAVPGQNI
jgi:hypothetical protein